MRITKRQLRRMIVSERRRLNENKRIRRVAVRADHLLTERSSFGMVSSKGRQAAMQMVQRSSPDAIAIYKALKGLGTDEDTVYAVLNKRQGSIPQLYEEFGALMVELKQAESGFMGKVKKYGMPFLAGSGLFALALNLSPDKAKGIENVLGKAAAVGTGDKVSEDERVALQHKMLADQEKGISGGDAEMRLRGLEDTALSRTHRQGMFKGKVSGVTGKELERKLASKIGGRKFSDAEREEYVMPKGAKSAQELSTGQKWAGAALTGAAVVAVAALISSILPDSLDDDLVDWLEDDGMDDAAQFVQARLQPGQQRG